MQSKNIPKMLETYYYATGIPVIGIQWSGDVDFHFPHNWNFNVFYDYFDFYEILEFTKSHFNGNTIIPPCHIFHTQNFFIYIITFLYEGQTISGAIASGPVAAFRPDESRVDELLSLKKLPLNRKPEIKSLLNSLPSIAAERIPHYCKLLFYLCKAESQEDNGMEPEIHNSAIVQINNYKATANQEDISVIYMNSYKLFMSLREKIVHGDAEGVGRLLSNSIDILWDTGNSKDTFNSLKCKYIILCTYSCICSIHGKVPYAIMMKLLQEAMESLNGYKTANEIVSGLISVIKACTQAVAVHSNNLYSMHVNQALQYIRLHYAEKISLDMLADHAGINPVYLSSLLKKETKLSLSDNINKIRIEESCNLLAYTSKSINEIAFTVGYSYQNHFNKIFKKFTGMTPFEYRKTHVNLI